uniref:Splicing factor 45 n=1 Tax=Caenorhabditis tropicalis TaxID=1561998 RepID=A0A1I7TZC0_9PELO
MSNDDEDDVPMGPPAAKQAKPMHNIQMAFMQTQLAQRKAALQQQARQKVAKSAAPPPVIDLSTRNRITSNATTTTTTIASTAKTFQPIRANPVAENISFLPKAATDESVLIFGEEHINCEYYPMTPNNFEILAKEVKERKQREKMARDIAKRLQREHEEEDKKRSMGAAIAPPTMLIEPEPEIIKENGDSKDEKPQSSFMPPPSFLPAFGKATSRGLGVAANIMKKHGYREGQGLGKSEQGMSTALQIEKTGVRGGNIVAEAPRAPTFASNSMEAVQNATKILQLWNLTDVSEVEDEEGKKEFSEEIKEEMEKCGQVVNVLVHVNQDHEEEERRVRVFVEFTNSAQAIKAFVMMNGRFFGGRSVSAGFQNVDEYNSQSF